MLFIDWRFFLTQFVIIFFIAAPPLAIWRLRRTRWFILLPVFTLAIFIVPAGVLLQLFTFFSTTTRSIVVYSPDHTMAARLQTSDEGSLGGSDYVDLFEWHGLLSQRVYVGGWHSIEAGDLRWKSNSELDVVYGYRRDEQCITTQKVSVVCTLKPQPQ